MRITTKRNPEQVRREALEYLRSTDWYTARLVDEGTPIPEDVKRRRAEYRQALRDLPANTTDPRNPTWPTKPE